jgi:ABC-type uncharacterized transport system auxiliary subunit
MDLMLFRNARATFFTRRAKVLGSLAVIATLCGCEMSRQDHLIEARAALADAAYDDAVAAAEAGLLRAAAAGAQDVLDDATSWGLELAKLEAYARAGHGEEAKAQLAQLAQLHPNRVEASEYFATAHQLRGAGAGTAAIEVLDRGAILFPYEPVIGRMIEVSGESGDPAELELLQALGYVDSD